MPFVSGKESRELTQGLTPYDSSTAATDFGEVFAASLGQVIDEDLTISHSLNREGWEERRSLTAEAINTDQVDRHKYMDRRGKFDYDRLAQEMPELGLKSDQVLADERNALLAQRRGYAQDVIERGSGIAQFLGAANAYMLDPVNIATIGVATASVSAKSLSVLGRALMVGRNEAALNAASELMIQPFVYGHKQEIDSPYAASDAIKNIAFAAAGGAVFGSAVGGISGVIGKSAKASKGIEPNIVARDAQEPDSLAEGVDAPNEVKAFNLSNKIETAIPDIDSPRKVQEFKQYYESNGIDVNADNTITLYHATNKESADKIISSKQFLGTDSPIGGMVDADIETASFFGFSKEWVESTWNTGSSQKVIEVKVPVQYIRHGGQNFQEAYFEGGLKQSGDVWIPNKLSESFVDTIAPMEYKPVIADVVDAPINGSTVGGISGYLSKAIKSAETLDIVTPDVEQSLQYLSRMQESIESGRLSRDNYDSVMKDYDSVLSGEYASYKAAADNTVKQSQKIINDTLKNEDTLGQFISKSGGIDRELIQAEGVDPVAFKDRGKVFGKPLYRKKGGKSADELAEALNEAGYKGGRLTANDVVSMIHDIANGADPLMNGAAKAKVDFHQNIIDDFSRSTDDGYLKSLYGDVRKLDIEEDVKYYNDLEARKVEANKPSKTPSDYFEPPKAKPKKAMGTDREREILKRTGIDEDFDADMDAYSRLDNPAIIKDGEMVEASSFMKELDDEIGGIESVLVCARG